MIEYIAKCKSVETDTITASVDGDTVELLAEQLGDYRMEVYLRPDAARTFARGILALADQIDGGEAGEDGPVVRVGDRFRVTQDYLECAEVAAGDVVTVDELTGDESFRATDADGRRWHFGLSSIGDGLEPLADMGRDLLEGSVTAQDSRLAALEHAKRLAPVGADLLAYARFLLGE